jgi:hypothetical protein
MQHIFVLVALTALQLRHKGTKVKDFLCAAHLPALISHS